MVYRPPKHKPAPGERPARPSTDPLSGAYNRADDPDEILKGDDRHLVAVDESYASGDMEDRLWLYWQRHNQKVVVVLIVICLGFIGWQGWNLYQSHLVNILKADYEAASASPATLLAFSQANANSTLGKVALLEAADGMYKNRQYKEAADAYGKAASAWAGDEQGQRAQLGWSLALLSTGDVAGAHLHLENLFNAGANLENYRAEAAFDNAVIYAQNGDSTNAAIWIDHAESLTNTPSWSTQAKTFREILPLLADIKLVSGNYQATPDAAKLPAMAVPTVPAAPANSTGASTPVQPVPATPAPVTAKPAASTATSSPAASASTAAGTGFEVNLIKNSK